MTTTLFQLPQAQRAKVICRESAVLRFRELLASQPSAGIERALAHTVAEFRWTGISTRSLRRWLARYERYGVNGLVEQKRGVVGRKKRKGGRR
jgi:hypothetical protein